MKKDKTILLTAGGTGGHFFPAVALCEELAAAKNLNLHLSTDNRCQKYISDKIPAKMHKIDIYINKSNILSKVQSVFSIVFSIIKAYLLVCKLKPNLVIGFGGYPTFPILFAAKWKKIPIILQEQNSIIGKTSKYFAPHAKLIATSFENTKNTDNFSGKIQFCGDLIRKSMQNIDKKDGFLNKKMHIFIFGGSQGAQIFSEITPKMIEELINIDQEITLKITHQVQSSEAAHIPSKNIDYVHAEFFHNIDEIYNEVDLVVSRAGASTIAELTHCGLPAIYVPYPYAADNHQFHNAMSLAGDSASWCIEQKDLKAKKIAKQIYEIYKDRSILEKASKKLIKRQKNGAQNLAATVLKIIER